MSRIGKAPINLPANVTVTVDDVITVNGPKGSLSIPALAGINVTVDGSVVTVTRDNDLKEIKSKHGLIRALINNMVIGVTDGFSKKLEINGVGYRANLEGQKIKLALGFSHDVYFDIPSDIQVVIEQNTITISGVDKQRVGQISAEIRALKKPEPYKGKGIKYSDEHILRKSGKSGKDK